MVTVVAAVVAVQLPLVTVTVKVPLAETVIDCVVAPLDQLYDVPALAVRVTLPPAQKDAGPLGVMVAVEELTVTMVEAAFGHPVPSVTVTEYVAVDAGETVMVRGVAPLDQL